MDGAVHVARLEMRGDSLACPACAADYPVIDGVPIVLRDVDAWLASEAPVVLARRDLGGPLFARVAEAAGGPLARDAALQRVYGAPEPCPLREVLGELLGGCEGPVLDVGCGAGVVPVGESTGIDLNFSLLRRYEGARVLGDALDPPFLGGAFRTVLLLNVLDSCRDPALLLAQAEGLLAPGGALVCACAFAYNDAITPRAARVGPAALLRALDGQTDAIPYPLKLRVEAVFDPVIWRLRLSERTVHEHACQVVVARKPLG